MELLAYFERLRPSCDGIVCSHEGAAAVGMRGIRYHNNAQAITELEALLGAI